MAGAGGTADGRRIPPAISLPPGEIVLLTEDVLPEMHRALQDHAALGCRQSPVLIAAAGQIGRAVRRMETAGSPSAQPAGLENRLGASRRDLQAAPSSQEKVINLDQAAALLGVTSRERARQLVDEHHLASWRNPDGRHETRVFRAEVIALAEERSGGHGTGGGEGHRAREPGGTARGGTARRGTAA